MATRAQKIRLALFFVVSSSVLALFFIVVAGSHLLHQRDSYNIEFTGVAVSGLNKGASVKYLGFNVGRVEGIYISPEDLTKVVVAISVERQKVENAIRTDTEARMASLGITGLKYIELFGGSNGAEELLPGSNITASETFFSNMQSQMFHRYCEEVMSVNRASPHLGHPRLINILRAPRCHEAYIVVRS